MKTRFITSIKRAGLSATALMSSLVLLATLVFDLHGEDIVKIKSGYRRAYRLVWATLVLTFWTLFLPWEVAAAVGGWTPLAHLAPVPAGHMLLLSDGTILVQHADDTIANTTNWYRLTPDSYGSYVNGSWSTNAPSHHSRMFYQSFVIPDGRVVFAGGEYGTGGNDVEVFNPVADASHAWTTPLLSPAPDIADASSELLPDGNLLVSPFYCNFSPPFHTLIYNPTSNTWSYGPNSIGSQNEATWIKLPDDSILTIDRCTTNASCNNDQSPADGYTNTERYIPSLNRWISDAPLPQDLLLWSNVEIGAALLLPNGKAFFIGGSGKTAIYTPSGTTNQGAWAAGADIPNGYVNQDAPAAMMVNGKILCVVHQVGYNNSGPSFFYEYDYLSDSFTQVSSPTGGWSDSTGANRISLLDLPNGQVLLSDTRAQLYVYSPNPTNAVASGKPAIHSVSWNSNGSLHLTGTGFNGISAGAAFGDNAQMDSNYPLVRFTDSSGNVYYGRTYNWSSTSVQTGGAVVSTDVALPVSLPSGVNNISVQVVANGIASDPVAFSGPVWVDFTYTGLFYFGAYFFPYNTMADGVGGVGSGGTILIKNGYHSPETLTISKPMTIRAFGTPTTIGR